MPGSFRALKLSSLNNVRDQKLFNLAQHYPILKILVFIANKVPIIKRVRLYIYYSNQSYPTEIKHIRKLGRSLIRITWASFYEVVFSECKK